MKLKLTKGTEEKQRGGGFWKMSQQFNRTNQIKPKQMVHMMIEFVKYFQA